MLRRAAFLLQNEAAAAKAAEAEARRGKFVTAKAADLAAREDSLLEATTAAFGRDTGPMLPGRREKHAHTNA